MSVPARSAHPAPRHGCSSRPWLEALPPAYRILSAAESRSTPKAALVSMRTLSCWSARHRPRSCAAPLARRTCGRMHRGRAARSRRLPDPHLNAKQPQGALAGAVDIELLGSARLQPVETLGTGRVDRRHVRVVAVGLDDRHAAANLPQDVPGHRGGRAHGRHTAAAVPTVDTPRRTSSSSPSVMASLRSCSTSDRNSGCAAWMRGMPLDTVATWLSCSDGYSTVVLVSGLVDVVRERSDDRVPASVRLLA